MLQTIRRSTVRKLGVYAFTSLLLLPLALAAAGCDDCSTDDDDKSTRRQCDAPPGAPTPVPAPTPPPVVTQTFEFRVLGDAVGAVDIRYGTTQEGTTILRSQAPWFVTVRTVRASSFLTLAARAAVDPDDLDPQPVFLHVQIVVNGIVFREASAIGLDPNVAVSGLYQSAVLSLNQKGNANAK